MIFGQIIENILRVYADELIAKQIGLKTAKETTVSSEMKWSHPRLR